ncbi:response regulator transcription factor [Ilumatobacter sp.]|uniref:response regulator transcription factor n=1 Tax=Ilumatobacter sp. TaxID=1967498 RepID=UPI003B528E05
MGKILVVEDDSDIREMVEFKLACLGHEVVVAHDGERGLEQARAERPDLVLADWMMPRLSGLDMFLAMRADPELAHLPVMLMSAKASDTDVRLGRAAGVDDYVVKPFNLLDLARRVEVLLDAARSTPLELALMDLVAVS